MNYLKIIYILLFFLFLSSCGSIHYTERIEEMKPPVILLSKSKNGSIFLIDKMGNCLFVNCSYGVASSISYSYVAGDTIIHKSSVND